MSRDAGSTAPAAPPGPAYQTPEVLSLLDGPHAGREVPRARQVFVNRNLRMDKIDAVGFDMDYTVVMYHLQRMEELAFGMTLARMVEALDYPAELRGLSYDPAFVIRGLVMDRQHGHIFKMDRHNHVGRAYHGRRPLGEEELHRLYRQEKIHLSSPRFAWIDTLFALPEACIFAEVIELLEGQGRSPEYERIWADIRESIDTVHRDGTLKSEVQKDLPRYVMKDPELGPTLHKLRSGGKKLFLLTNSLADYTDVVMRFVLDGLLPEYPSWRNYFDAVITGAAKPAFFSGPRPLHLLSPSGERTGPASTIERGRWYEGGDLPTFERLMGIGGDRVLYVGDHIYGDILRSRKSSLWRTCMVVEELERELAWLERNQPALDELAQLEELRVRIEDEIAVQRSTLNVLERRIDREEVAGVRDRLAAERRRDKARLETLRHARRDADGRIAELHRQVEEGFNAYWGLTFKEGNENSRFGEQIENYACLYTSRVSNLVFYSPMQYFRSPRAAMAHERAAPARISPWGDEHGAPVAGDRPSRVSKASS
jgi:HAD superfamily 5'-nucleotidase-like hydrolase